MLPLCAVDGVRLPVRVASLRSWPRGLQWSPEWLITTSLPPRVTGGDRWAWIRSRTRPLAGPTKGSCCLLLQMRGETTSLIPRVTWIYRHGRRGRHTRGKKGKRESFWALSEREIDQGQFVWSSKKQGRFEGRVHGGQIRTGLSSRIEAVDMTTEARCYIYLARCCIYLFVCLYICMYCWLCERYALRNPND